MQCALRPAVSPCPFNAFPRHDDVPVLTCRPAVSLPSLSRLSPLSPVLPVSPVFPVSPVSSSKGRPYTSVKDDGHRSVGRVKLLNPYKAEERLMVYCCHGGAPPENRFMWLKEDVTQATAAAAAENGKADPALFVSGRKGEKNYAMLEDLHSERARTCELGA